MGSTSLDGTTITNIQVQNSEGKEIYLEKIDETRSNTPLYSIEMPDQGIQNASMDLDQNPSPLEEYDPYMSPIWDIDTPNIHHILDQTFSSDEAIMEVINISERPWEDMHHRASFISKPDSLEVKHENCYLNDDME